MTTEVLTARIPVDDIARKAREADPRKVLAILVTAPFWFIGWVIGKTALALWVAGAWGWAAISTGLADARGPSKRKQITDLEQEIAWLREENKRLQ